MKLSVFSEAFGDAQQPTGVELSPAPRGDRPSPGFTCSTYAARSSSRATGGITGILDATPCLGNLAHDHFDVLCHRW